MRFLNCVFLGTFHFAICALFVTYGTQTTHVQKGFDTDVGKQIRNMIWQDFTKT